MEPNGTPDPRQRRRGKGLSTYPKEGAWPKVGVTAGGAGAAGGLPPCCPLGSGFRVGPPGGLAARGWHLPAGLEAAPAGMGAQAQGSGLREVCGTRQGAQCRWLLCCPFSGEALRASGCHPLPGVSHRKRPCSACMTLGRRDLRARNHGPGPGHRRPHSLRRRVGGWLRPARWGS